jgi:hypothetical protein
MMDGLSKNSKDNIRAALEARQIRDMVFRDLTDRLNKFTGGGDARRSFYLDSILTWASDLTDGEVSILGPLVHEKLGISREAFGHDVRAHRRALLEKEKENGILKKTEGSHPVLFAEVMPWESRIDGGALLQEIIDFISSYVVLPKNSAAAVAAWAMATWCREKFYFAPILAVLSPVKRCGKSHLLEILNQIVFRPRLTSVIGISPAVLYRMNEDHHPTFLIDEAEKLAGDDTARELISLLNSGHRKGMTVQRCTSETQEIQVFDAHGFRAVAAIGKLWDTLTDRAIIIQMTRKPPNATVKRFSIREVEREGAILARKICRWVQDNQTLLAEAEETAPRPEFLHDRGCDNWAALFSIGILAGGGWLDRLQEAARTVSIESDDGDRGEILIADLKAIFADHGDPDRIGTELLIEALNKIESSPWGDLNSGKGLSPHKLAAILRRFGVRPSKWKAAREMFRGYDLEALRPIFDQYTIKDPPPPPLENEINNLDEKTSAAGNNPEKDIRHHDLNENSTDYSGGGGSGGSKGGRGKEGGGEPIQGPFDYEVDQ